jgi:class 3 adenylate cyclase/tetratricopeptide (TPR) repeat protein
VHSARVEMVPTPCPECHAVVDDGAVCTRCGLAAQSRTTAGSSLPPPLASIAEGGELREATVLFCDLGGYTAWNEEEEPEAVVPVMDRIKLQAIRIFEEHGGIANQFVGDEILGLFGVTASNEDDPCRATSAALELHAYVRAQEVLRPNGERRVLELHTGIDTGWIFVRVTDSRGGLYDVTGDTVNTAARLRALAEAGQILVGPTTHERIWMHFDTAPLAPTAVRGKAHPVVPHQVLGRVRLSSPLEASLLRHGLTTYVGREAALGTLQAAWSSACAGHGTLLTVEGAAGIGKSRLSYELRRHVLATTTPTTAPAPLVLHGRCSSYRVAAYQPFIEALLAHCHDESAEGGVLAQLSALAPLSRDSLQTLSYLVAPGASPPEHVPAEGERRREAIVDALHELLTLSAQVRPVLLSLEDFHDADEPSRAALRMLAQRAVGLRVLIVVNFRPSESSPTLRALSSQHVPLEPLDGETARTLACGVLTAASLAPDLARFIHERTLGNPFFVEEICRSLLEAGGVTQRFGMMIPTRSLELSRAPPSLQSIVRARVERLPAEHKKALRLASVLGLEFSLEALLTLWENPRPTESVLVAESAWRSLTPAEAEPLDVLLFGLEAQGLVASVSGAARGGYRFKHAITQEVVYESLPRRGRRWYHGLAAAQLEQQCSRESLEFHYETLAYHYGLSDHLDKAIDYTILSADKAARSFALEQAAAMYARATGLFAALGELSRAHKQRYTEMSLGWARVGLYNPQREQVAALKASYGYAQERNDERCACLCLNWMSWLEYALGNQTVAQAHSQEFLQTARTLGEPALEAQALTNLGLCHTMATEYTEAVRTIEARIHQRGRSTGTAHAYSLGYLALIRGDQGAFEQAFEHLRAAARIIDPMGRDTLQGPFLIQRGMVESFVGDFSTCLQTATRASAIAERIGGQYIGAMSLALAGYAEGMLSAAARARGIERVRAGVGILENEHVHLHLSWCRALLAELLALSGDHRQAAATAQAALARVAERDCLGEVTAHRVLARVALADREPERAHHHLELAHAAALRKQSPREVALTQLQQAELLHDRGERQRAGELVQQARRACLHLGLRSSPQPLAFEDVHKRLV